MAILKPEAGTNSSPNGRERSAECRASILYVESGRRHVRRDCIRGRGSFEIRSDPNAGFKDQVDRLSNRIGSLEDANAIRRMHQTYESHLDQGMYEEVVDMFTDDGEVSFQRRAFCGKEEGDPPPVLRPLRSGMTGKKLEPAPGFEQDPAQELDIVEVAADRKSATGQFPFSMQVGKPMNDDSPLVKMARLQGEGIVKWWEGGIYEASYVKIGDTWKIKRLEYRASSKADYRPGRSLRQADRRPGFCKYLSRGSGWSRQTRLIEAVRAFWNTILNLRK